MSKEICREIKVSPKTLDQVCKDEAYQLDTLADYCGPWKRVARKLLPSDNCKIHNNDEIEDDNKKAADQKSGFIRRWVQKLRHT